MFPAIRRQGGRGRTGDIAAGYCASTGARSGGGSENGGRKTLLLGLLAVLVPGELLVQRLSLASSRSMSGVCCTDWGGCAWSRSAPGSPPGSRVIDRLQEGQHADHHLAGPGPGRNHPRDDAVVHFQAMNPLEAAVDVQRPLRGDRARGTNLTAVHERQERPRRLLRDRDELNSAMALMIDSPAAEWDIVIDRVEIKDAPCPDTTKRFMSRQADAEGERRARIITADGEVHASETLAQAAEVTVEHPAALQSGASDGRRGCHRATIPRPISGTAPSLPHASWPTSATLPVSPTATASRPGQAPPRSTPPRASRPVTVYPVPGTVG